MVYKPRRERNPREVWITLLAIALVSFFIGLVVKL